MTPRLLKTAEDHRLALARVDSLMAAEPGTPAADDLALWVHLVALYEDEHHAIDLPDPVAAIRFRMDQQGLAASDLVRYIGGPGLVDDILHGRRPLTLPMIRRLHAGLGIPAESLLGPAGTPPPKTKSGPVRRGRLAGRHRRVRGRQTTE